MIDLVPPIALGALLLLSTSCTQLYYKAQEKIGNEKRDILVDRIKKGREERQEAKELVKSKLEAFQAATGFKGGKTEETQRVRRSRGPVAQGDERHRVDRTGFRRYVQRVGE